MKKLKKKKKTNKQKKQKNKTKNKNLKQISGEVLEQKSRDLIGQRKRARITGEKR